MENNNIRYRVIEPSAAADGISADTAAMLTELRTQLETPAPSGLRVGTRPKAAPADPFALAMHYETNCTCAQLRHLCDFYGVKGGGRRKAELANRLAEFEATEGNQEAVSERKELWRMIKRLREDPYLSRWVALDVGNS